MKRQPRGDGGAGANVAADDDDVFGADYDDVAGACVNANGDVAINHIPLWFIQETGLGACADLSWTWLNGDDFSMPELGGWDLRGADLSEAQLAFANLSWAALQGANLETFSFGYAVVAGVIDDATVLPGVDGCDVSDNPWAGQQLRCER